MVNMMMRFLGVINMNQHLMNLMSIDYVSLLLALGTVVVGFVAIKKAIEEFCQTFGIELKYLREKREQRECQTEVKSRLAELSARQDKFEHQHEENIKVRDEFNNKIMKCINDLKADIVDMRDEIEYREAEKRFKKLRFDLLNFASRIAQSEEITGELISQVNHEITEYEELVEQYNFKNNRVNTSIKIIQEKYEQLLREGKILIGS